MSIFDAIGDLFSSEGKSLSQTWSDLGKAPSFGRFWNSFQGADPVMHGFVDDQSKLDDRITGTVLGAAGAKGAGAYFDKEASDPTQAAMQHVLAGLAWAGGSAALGAGGEAGGGAAADSGSVNLFSDAVPGAGGDVGASAGGAGAGAGGGASAGGSSWLDYGKTTAKALAPALLNAAMQPKPPRAAPVRAMPDPLAQEQAQRQKLIDQLARRGRASTILTSASNGSLGG